jgi:hypothetical protein
VVASLAFGVFSASRSNARLSSSLTAPAPTPATRPRTVSNSSRASDVGPGASLHGRQLFPPDNPWNQDISNAPIDPNSKQIVTTIGAEVQLHPDFGTLYMGAPNGIPYVVVSGSQPMVPINLTSYAGESDRGPYPVPRNAPVEGGANSDGDRHVLVVDRDNWKLYEMFRSFLNPDGSWRAASGAIFDLKSNALRPEGWTSSDAAGLPIFPGLVRYDEVFEQREIKHALRFTVKKSRRAYVFPARHYASSDTNPYLPPMGMRVRLKASFDMTQFSPANRVILRALQKYGMIVADNGGNWFLSGAPDMRWSDEDLSKLKIVTAGDFEVVRMDRIVTK